MPPISLPPWQYQRQSHFYSFVEFASDYPGNLYEEADVRLALETVNQLAQCLPE